MCRYYLYVRQFQFSIAAMKRTLLGLGILSAVCLMLWAQQAEIIIRKAGEKPVVAVPDFRGNGVPQPAMDIFNQTLFRELQDSGQIRMAPKTVYPLAIPQQPPYFKAPVVGSPRGPGMTDWSRLPLGQNYVAVGIAYAKSANMERVGCC